MPDSKEDYLSYCNNQGVPVEDFKAAFCSRCFNPTCSRSLAGQSLFEARIHTWHERLFENPQTLPKEDPRYALISAVNFQEVPVGPIPTVGQSAPPSAWMDPRDLGAAPEPSKPAPQKVAKPRAQAPEPAETMELELVPSTPPEAPQKSAEPQVQPSAVSIPRQAPLQTPFQQGVMIGNASVPQATPPKDPWAATPSPTETAGKVKVIQPGGKVRFGE